MEENFSWSEKIALEKDYAKNTIVIKKYKMNRQCSEPLFFIHFKF